jgi:hypothetical protein
MAKKIAREAKYYSPNTDYDALVEDLASRDVESVREVFHTEATDDSITASTAPDISEEELDEYLAWAKEAAEKAAQEKSSEKAPKK